MSELLPSQSATLATTLNSRPARPATDSSQANPELDALRHSAEQFEAVFLAEMLKHTGLGKMPDGFNGGEGEAAFSDFLTKEYAEQIAKSRSTGIADQVFDLLRKRSGL